MSGRCLNRFEQRAINALVLAMVDLDTMPDVLEQQLEACANLLRCSVAQVTVLASTMAVGILSYAPRTCYLPFISF